MIIKRLNNIRGIRILRFGKYQAELWFCPRAEVIPTHSHRDFVSSITFLGGRMEFRKQSKSIDLSWRSLFKTFTIEAGEPHGATVTGGFGLFLNFERWIKAPTSAATDFHPI